MAVLMGFRNRGNIQSDVIARTKYRRRRGGGGQSQTLLPQICPSVKGLGLTRVAELVEQHAVVPVSQACIYNSKCARFLSIIL